MAKVLVFNIPLHGHINPTLAVIHELVARGEEVVYYLTEEFKPKIQSTGAVFRRYEPLVGTHVVQQPLQPEQSEARFLLRLVAESFHIIPQLLDDVRAEQPDYVIYDYMSLWGRLLAEILRVPTVRSCVNYAANVHFPMHIYSSLQALTPESDTMVKLNTTVEQLCTKYNVQAFDLRKIFWHAEPLNIVFIPRAFQPAADTFDERFQFVGPSILPGNEPIDLPTPQLSLRPTLYISLGTIFTNNVEFFNMCFAAFGNQLWQVVLAIGNKIDQRTLDPIPTNFLVHSYVSQLDVLQYTDIFITHGGMNSVMEALYYGVPLVVIPQLPSYDITAERVAELGLGVAIEKTSVTAQVLQDAVTQIKNQPEFHKQAKRMQEVVRSAGGYRGAADAILQFSRQMLHS